MLKQKPTSPIQHNSSNLAPDSSGFSAISSTIRGLFETIQAQLATIGDMF
jgi:hypothetical protein